MKLYLITWTTCGRFGLSAVVAAETSELALAELGLSELDTLDAVAELGTAISGRFVKAEVIVRESL